MWSVLAVSLVIAQIVSVENAVLLEETTTGRSHQQGKEGRHCGSNTINIGDGQW